MPKSEDEFVPNPDQPIHQGKWTPEEEDYVHGLIEEFKAGLLPLAEGTSLRTFLSKMLNCQPMRISKKFVGSNYNGKQVYVRRKNTLSNDAVRARRAKLQELERKFLAKASPMSALNSSDSITRAAAPKPSSHADIPAAAAGLLGGSGGLPQGMDAAMLAGRSGSNSKAAAAGRALLLGGSGGLKPSAGGGGPGGSNLGGFSSAELAAELEKRSNMELQTRSSVENFLGSAAELQARASVETLLQNPFGRTGSRSNLFNAAASGSRSNLLNAAASGSRTNLLNAARGSFHRGTSASNLLNAALQKNSTSNLLNAARGSFHKNSTSNLLNAARNSFHKNSTSNLLNASAFARGTSASNLLNATASSFKKNSTSNLLNAMASSGALRNRKNSTSNLLNAARAGGDSSGLQALLAARAEKREARNSSASLSDFLERHNSMDFQSRVSGLMEKAQEGRNWSSSLGSAGRGSRSNLANLRSIMQNDGEGGGSSIFGNSSFAGGDNSDRKNSRNLDLAQLLKEKGMGAAAAMAAAADGDKKESSLNAEMLEKEALMRQLKSAGFDSGNSPINEYLLKQQLAGGGGSDRPDADGANAADEAELRHMLELKRKFLSQDAAAELEERAAKRLREGSL